METKKTRAERLDRLKECREPLMKWYKKTARALPWREDSSPYHVWLSEIMLQQTRIEAVIEHYFRFLEALPDIADLAAAPEEQVLKLWQGLGYYSRARNLQKAAGQIMALYDGKFPDTYEKIVKLPGIGEYTAGAIASIAFGIPVPAVDGNVLRLLSRLLSDERDVLLPETKKSVTKELAATVPEDEPGIFNQALMELGETVCLPNGVPLCGNCPVRQNCLAHKAGRETELPVRVVKTKRRLEERQVFLIRYQDKIVLHKRDEKGLLAGLWELPNIDLNSQNRGVLPPAWGFHIRDMKEGPRAKHLFTHIEWRMQLFIAEALDGQLPPEGSFVYADRKALEESYALPSAFKAFEPYLWA